MTSAVDTAGMRAACCVGVGGVDGERRSYFSE